MYVQILKTIIGKNLNIDSLLTPVILHLTLTNRCNSQCVMCNIWADKNKEDVKTESLMKYKNSIFGRNLRVLDLTGGEPFLCDLPSIVKMLDNGKLKTILISSNGFLSEKIESDIKQLLYITKAKIIVDISIDGIGERHEEIRGVPYAYEKAIKTIKTLKKLGDKRIRVSLKMTILKKNIDQIMDCYMKSEELGVDFTCKPGTNFGFLQNEDMNFELQKSDYNEIINCLEKISKRRASNLNFSNLSFWDRFFVISNNLFSDKLIEYYKFMRDGIRNMITPCYSSFLSIMLHNDNTIYSCPTLMKKIGALNGNSLESIWSSDDANKVRKFINDKKCACFSQCDQMPALVLGNIHKVMAAVLISYIK